MLTFNFLISESGGRIEEEASMDVGLSENELEVCNLQLHFLESLSDMI
jgi:hypothetical protein